MNAAPPRGPLCQNRRVSANDPAERPRTNCPPVRRFGYRIAENRWEWSDEVARMHGVELPVG